MRLQRALLPQTSTQARFSASRAQSAGICLTQALTFDTKRNVLMSITEVSMALGARVAQHLLCWQRGMATRNDNTRMSHLADSVRSCPSRRARASGTARAMHVYSAVLSSTRGIAVTAAASTAIAGSLLFVESAADVLGASSKTLHKGVFFLWVSVSVVAGTLAVAADAVILWRGIRQQVVMAGFCSQAVVLPASRPSWCASHQGVPQAQRWAKVCHIAVVGLCNLLLIAGTAWFWSIWTFGGCIQNDAGLFRVAQSHDQNCFDQLLTAICFVVLGIIVRSLTGLWFRYKTSDQFCEAADLREAERCIATTSMRTPDSRVGYATACLSEMAESAATADRMEWTTDSRNWRLNSTKRKFVMQRWAKLFLLDNMPQIVEDANTQCSVESTLTPGEQCETWVDLMHWMCQAMGLEHAAVVFNRHNLSALSRGPGRDYPGGKSAAQVVSEGIDVIFGRSAEGAIRYPWHANRPRRKFFFVPRPHRTLARLDKTIQECELMDDRIKWRQPPGGTVNHASLLVVVAICLHSKRDLTEKFREKFQGTLNLNLPDQMLRRGVLSSHVRSDNFLDSLRPLGRAVDAAAGAEAAAGAAAE